jgi:glycosyltransferase involved in cell wall biosynthesis
VYSNRKIAVIIPALNEEKSIRKVINEIPGFTDEIIVVDNSSEDRTSEEAQKSGATVLTEEIKGYGAACLKGIEYVSKRKYDIIVFLDADFSDYPGEMERLLIPIIKDDYDLVLGTRMLGKREPGAMLLQALWGNRLASFFIKIFWNYKFTDLGPFRAIKYSSLNNLDMKDKNYGWTIEMQIKAAKRKLKVTEVPVSYRKRIGKSKVTGTIKGTFKASVKILYLIFREIFKDLFNKRKFHFFFRKFHTRTRSNSVNKVKITDY